MGDGDDECRDVASVSSSLMAAMGSAPDDEDEVDAP
jgi:hypothetical protein